MTDVRERRSGCLHRRALLEILMVKGDREAVEVMSGLRRQPAVHACNARYWPVRISFDEGAKPGREAVVGLAGEDMVDQVPEHLGVGLSHASVCARTSQQYGQ